ncbi:MAG TPA: PD-(D/E)XK nuclease family protein [Acidimicrobiia bacterium]|nr:PD-(D/E)XK nuclease family protein [Acidimicrobiia bacterium]
MIEFPPIQPGFPVSVSATTYISFRRCPAQGLGRFHGRYPKESKASFRGGLAHGLIARHLQSGPIDNPEQAAREVIGSTALNNKIAAAGLNRPSLLAPVISEASDLYRRFSKLPVHEFERAEVGLLYEVADGVTLIGQVDAVFAGPLLRDWKTGPLGDSLEQLLFYALVWCLQEKTLPRVEAISLQTGESMTGAPSVSELAAVASRVADLVNFVRRTVEAERRAGPWCRFCPLWEECPEGQAASAINN